MLDGHVWWQFILLAILAGFGFSIGQFLWGIIASALRIGGARQPTP